ncbi:mediator of RNA polymerase II transcription subunit 1-like, partial [Triticum urartu]|uniref:mediator of RNA polymerase II transcription subunit 1-like n=1 Tax=Triticum urartu TaxID=4572 RepID=UPI002044198F
RAPVLPIPSSPPASPIRVKLAGGSGATRSSGNSVSVSSQSSTGGASAASSRRSCMCSSTNHPGSFRCSLHKERKQATPAGSSKPASPPSIRSTCSLGSKRMDSGQCARRALAPSPAAQHSQQRRRVGGFRPRPSRLSATSTAGERPIDKYQ